MSSDLSSLDDKGADNHDLSPRAIELDCLWIAKVSLKLSRSTDIESSTKDADDHIGLCVSSGSLASS